MSSSTFIGVPNKSRRIIIYPRSQQLKKTYQQERPIKINWAKMPVFKGKYVAMGPQETG
jgi:hypothetical protein